MRLLYIEPTPCIRALKLAKGLKGALGEDVSIIFGYLNSTLTDLYGYGDEMFDKFVELNKKDLEKSISLLVEKYKPHIIHSHNAPDFLTVSSINAIDNVPIIHDTHDVITMRNTGYNVNDNENRIKEYAKEEKIANMESYGRLYVTEGVRDYLKERYKTNPEFELVYPNYVSEEIMPNNFSYKLSDYDGATHIVYAGTITSKTDGHHYDLRDIFRNIAEQGFHIHIYASRNDDGYSKLAEKNDLIHYYGNVHRESLLKKELPKYDFGWAGFNDTMNKDHLDVALPNKAIEYIACGLPIITFPHKTLKEFVEQHRVGYVINDFEDLNNQLFKTNKDTDYLIKKRYDFTIEKNISNLIEFYQKIIDSY